MSTESRPGILQRIGSSPLAAPIGVLIVFLTVGGMAAASVIAGETADARRTELSDEIQPFDRGLRDLEIDVYRGATDSRGYTSTGNARFRLRFLAVREEIESAPVVMQFLADGTGFEDDSENVSDLALAWLATADRSVEAAARGDAGESERILIEEGSPALDAFTDAATSLEMDIRLETERIQASIEDTDRVERLVFYLAVPIGIMAGAVLIWLAVVNNRLLRSTEEGLARLDSMVGAIQNYGVLELDNEGRVTFASNAAQVILGYTSDGVRGREAHNVLHPDHGDRSAADLCPMADVFSGNRQERIEDVFRRGDGTDVPVEVNGAAVVIGTERTGSVVVFQDITERLQERRSREAFLTFASHELRSPLTSIMGFAHWLNRRVTRAPDAFDEPVRDAVETMHREALRMRTITEVVLDLASMQSGGRLRLRHESFELRELVQQEVLSARERHPEAQIEMNGSAERLPVISDPGRVSQVLVNLLNNAARYGGAKPVVSVAVEGGDDQVSVRVSDNGPGIPPEDQPYIFREYYQGRPGQSMPGSGLGIGLFISRRIAEQLGGSLTFRNLERRGAEFVMTLPVVGDQPD